MRVFVKKLGELHSTHKALELHIGLAEKLREHTAADSFHRRLQCEQSMLASGSAAEVGAHVEELITQGAPLPSVLRLLCLGSLVGSGIKQKVLSHIHSELFHEYGYGALALTMQRLTRLGLLRRQEGGALGIGNAIGGAINGAIGGALGVGLALGQGGGYWNALRRNLRLVEELREVPIGSDPHELNYIFSGYAPLSVRIIEWMLEPLWASRDEALRALPGPLLSYELQHDGHRSGGGGLLQPPGRRGPAAPRRDPPPGLAAFQKLAVSATAAVGGAVVAAASQGGAVEGGAAVGGAAVGGAAAGGAAAGGAREGGALEGGAVLGAATEGGRVEGFAVERVTTPHGAQRGGGVDIPPPKAAATLDAAAAAAAAAAGGCGAAGGSAGRPRNPAVTLVVFLGGVTYSEMAALRWLGPRVGQEFVVVSTHICTGDDVIESLLEPLDTSKLHAID